MTLRLARDHPRVCGEHLVESFCELAGLGSSPRVRGTPSTWQTPASSTRDHPRVCGEHLLLLPFAVVSPGSSPRVRGTLPCSSPPAQTPGIIPACAGNTGSGAAALTDWRDHPRVCGEHASCSRTSSLTLGSSPRVRGTHLQQHEGIQRAGIIPACAGNTPKSTRNSRMCRDHPRVCGEHTVYRSFTSRLTGSSPRVRGTLDVPSRSSVSSGIIPACAGNTCRTACCGSSCRDHPRVCGEHYAGYKGNMKTTGSSPRVRGTQGRDTPR